jgi:Gas vesicle protein
MPEVRQVTRTNSSLAGLIDALDAVIGNGAVVAGDVVIALDGIDLIKLDLRLLLAGVQGVPVAAEAS